VFIIHLYNDMKRKQHQYSLTTVLIWASKISFGLG